MSVSWIKDQVETRVTHVGLVMSKSWSREVRIWSDVWENEYLCFVWNPETHRRETLVLGCSYDAHSEMGNEKVDASPEIFAEWALLEKADNEAARVRAQAEAAAQREENAKNEALKIRSGSEVMVTEGRKIPVGTRGVVCWMGQGNFGARVGFTDANGKTHYTSESNVKGVLPGKPLLYTPPEGWVAFLDAQVSQAQAVNPRKGDKVRRLSDGQEGTVFWVKENRLGFKITPQSEAIWANAGEVTILDGKGNPKAAPAPVMAPPPSPAEKVNPLAHLPAPYCDIRGILPPIGENTCWTAVDGKGEFLMNLTDRSAENIRKLVAAAE